MGGIGKALFGSKSKTKVKQAPTLTPEQRKLLDKLTNLLHGELGQGIDVYQGQRVAGAAPLQETAFNLADELSRYDVAGQEPYQKGLTALDRVLSEFSPEEATQFWEQSFKKPAIRTWERDIIPKIQEHYIGLNAGSSGAINRAIARSGEELTSNLGSKLADILFQAKQEAETRRMSGIPMALSYSTTPGAFKSDILSTVLGTGGVQRGITQEQLQAEMEKWQEGQPWANPWLRYLPVALGTPAFENIVKQSGGSRGLLGSVLPMVGRVVGGKLFGSFFGPPKADRALVFGG